MPKATEKECRRCRIVKPADAFRDNLEHSDQLSSWCRDCHNESHAINRVRGRRMCMQSDDPKVWEAKAKLLNHAAKWCCARATLTGAQLHELFTQWGGKCLACGGDKAVWVYIRPVQEAGCTKDNIQAVCGACLLKKGAFDVDFRTTPPRIVHDPFGAIVAPNLPPPRLPIIAVPVTRMLYTEACNLVYRCS